MSNLRAMYDSLIDHVTEITNPKPYEQWVKENTKLNGLPFSTARYPFQKQILNDMHINMDVMKISQVGISEIQIRKALAMAYRNQYKNIIFSLPDEPMRDRISSTRA